jgi:hypothetical protein
MMMMMMIIIIVIIIICLRKNLEAILGKHSINSVPKTATRGTSHVTRKVQQCENLKPERWGSPVVQEKYRGERACDKIQQR